MVTTLTIDERNNQTETIAGTDIKLHAEFDGSLEKMVAARTRSHGCGI